MKLSVPFMISMMLVATLPRAAAQSKPKDMRGVESEIKSLEARRFQAMVAADAPALENLLSYDLVYTHATAWRQNKAEFLASIRAREIQYHSITSENLNLHIYGSTIVVTGAASIKARAKGQELSVDLLYLEVFEKQDGRWQLVAWESTRRAP
jgi:ketosteroid isomerase-like protein